MIAQRPGDQPGSVVEMKTRRTYFLDYPCDLKPGENGHLHPEPSRRRLVRELAAPLLSRCGLQGQVPPRDRDAQLADACLVGRPTTSTCRTSSTRRRPDRQAEHQGVLAGRALAGRHDVQPDRAHRLLQGQSRRVAQSVRRPPGRESGPRGISATSTAGRRARGRAGGAGGGGRAGDARTRRSRGGAARASAERFLVHLRNGPARDG